jgi:hypothetical protein
MNSMTGSYSASSVCPVASGVPVPLGQVEDQGDVVVM